MKVINRKKHTNLVHVMGYWHVTDKHNFTLGWFLNPAEARTFQHLVYVFMTAEDKVAIATGNQIQTHLDLYRV